MTEREIVSLLFEAVAQSDHVQSDVDAMTEWLDKIDRVLTIKELEEKLGLSN